VVELVDELSFYQKGLKDSEQILVVLALETESKKGLVDLTRLVISSAFLFWRRRTKKKKRVCKRFHW